MTNFYLSAAGIILFTVAIGLVRVLSGPSNADRVMATQLLGTGGIASLLLVAAATGVRGVEDVALGLSLLAAFAAIGFVDNATEPGSDDSEGGSDR